MQYLVPVFALLLTALPAMAQPVVQPIAQPIAQPNPAPTTPPAASTPASDISKLDRMAEIVKSLSGYFDQEEINLLYAHFRDRFIVQLTGHGEVEELPPDLMFRIKILEKRFDREGKQALEDGARELDAFLAKYAPTTPPANTNPKK